jgi:hypothetical protein
LNYYSTLYYRYWLILLLFVEFDRAVFKSIL